MLTTLLTWHLLEHISHRIPINSIYTKHNGLAEGRSGCFPKMETEEMIPIRIRKHDNLEWLFTCKIPMIQQRHPRHLADIKKVFPLAVASCISSLVMRIKIRVDHRVWANFSTPANCHIFNMWEVNYGFWSRVFGKSTPRFPSCISFKLYLESQHLVRLFDSIPSFCLTIETRMCSSLGHPARLLDKCFLSLL